MIVDTSFLLAALIPDQRLHDACAATLVDAEQPVVSPFVMAELDYFTARIAGIDAELAMLSELVSGAYELPSFDNIDLTRARAIVERYRDLRISLADASLVVLTHRYQTHEIATLDERHFRVVRSLTGQPFTLLPADLPA